MNTPLHDIWVRDTAFLYPGGMQPEQERQLYRMFILGALAIVKVAAEEHEDGAFEELRRYTAQRAAPETREVVE